MSALVRVPGDKSISHRVLILAALAGGTSRLRGVAESQDVARTAGALAAIGARIEGGAGELRVPGPAAWRDARARIDCGNSGTTARLLAGLTAGLGVEAELDGDASLRRRPMDRVVYPLQAMGARLRYLEERGTLPVRVERRASGSLRPLRHRARVASAQVKTALLLAGLASRTPVEVIEPLRSRDHTERLLRHQGAPLRAVEEAVRDGAPGWRVALEPEGWDGRLAPLDLTVPGDPSSAAFLVAAALLGAGEIRIPGVALNPTRTEFVQVVREMGGDVELRPSGEEGGEPVGEIRARPSELRAMRIEPDRVPWLLDEIPVLAALASRAEGTFTVTGAGELRVKESDRLALLHQGLVALGVRCRPLPDGLEIEGTAGPMRGAVRTGGDHRLAMAFGLLDRLPGSRVRVENPACVGVSYPGFWETLERVWPRSGG